MILPNKSTSFTKSILGIGSKILLLIDESHSISSLWQSVKYNYKNISYQKFILTLDLLYALDLIQYQEGMIKKVKDVAIAQS